MTGHYPTKKIGNMLEQSIIAAEETAKLLHIHLRATEFLASFCWSRGIMAFKLRPKHHYVWHVCQDLVRTQLNPKLNHCWSDEKWLGRLKKIGCRTHGSTVHKRAIERFLVALSVYMAKLPS